MLDFFFLSYFRPSPPSLLFILLSHSNQTFFFIPFSFLFFFFRNSHLKLPFPLFPPTKQEVFFMAHITFLLFFFHQRSLKSFNAFPFTLLLFCCFVVFCCFFFSLSLLSFPLSLSLSPIFALFLLFVDGFLSSKGRRLSGLRF
ncbi:hypothetical protein BDR26DRAFT_420879 [Obelidium mucronatum]|nr:hypothetical protein BDR26DRAFT_420879 [Obelidium mucronatum]